jgi:D-alanyl-D-alanine carboxypeptidase
VAEATRYEEFNMDSKIFKNTDKLAENLPGLIAGKTGFSDLAGGNLAVAVDIGLNHPVIIVVLGSTEEGRFEDVKELYYAIINSK